MAERVPNVLICSCEDTMPLDVDAIKRGCRNTEISNGRQLCRAELAKVRAAAERGPVIVGCIQETAALSEAAGDARVTFVNLRETAGWSKEAAAASPKMAALIAAAAEPVPDYTFVSLTSEGTTLIYGRDERAIEAARLLTDHLDITVLITNPRDIAPPRGAEFPVAKGTIRSAKGHLGAFEVMVDDYALPAPSSRMALEFASPRDGATSRCDLILDLSGNAPLFPASDLRDGYLRADPGDLAAVLRAVLQARDLTGTFDKPRYVNFTEELCAYSRSTIVGCRRCLDLCPTGAIAPAGHHVAIDAAICAGCGQCAAACPTGAASYALPPEDALLRKLRAMLSTYREAGGERAVILLHDDAHGGALIDALARHGDGLPANVLPLTVNEVTQVGLEAIAAAFAYGAAAVRFLLRAKPRHEIAGLTKTIALAEPILAGLGFGDACVGTIETDDPFALGEALHALEPRAGTPRPASFMPVGAKRGVLKFALRALHDAAPAPVDVIALAPDAPFGKVDIDVAGCTLCLSCVSACPTGALSDGVDLPLLRFAEDACLQCGLCKATCPEKVITLTPQIDFRAATAQARVLKQEEPFECVRCGKPFGVKSTIERIAAKLQGKHWMYSGDNARFDVIKMCSDCRVQAMTEQDFDPYGAPARAAPRTSDDYLRERNSHKPPGK
jgi:ferredoxin